MNVCIKINFNCKSNSNATQTEKLFWIPSPGTCCTLATFLGTWTRVCRAWQLLINVHYPPNFSQLQQYCISCRLFSSCTSTLKNV